MRVSRGPRRSIDDDLLVDDARPAACHQRYRRRVEPVLGFEHAGGQRFGRVGRKHGDGGLGDDRAGVDAWPDQVGGTAVDPGTGRERARVGVESGKGREQRRVDVEQAIAPVLDELRREDSHEAGKADELDAFLRRAGG